MIVDRWREVVRRWVRINGPDPDEDSAMRFGCMRRDRTHEKSSEQEKR
jgi:hypothetical protein